LLILLAKRLQETKLLQRKLSLLVMLVSTLIQRAESGLDTSVWPTRRERSAFKRSLPMLWLLPHPH